MSSSILIIPVLALAGGSVPRETVAVASVPDAVPDRTLHVPSSWTVRTMEALRAAHERRLAVVKWTAASLHAQVVAYWAAQHLRVVLIDTANEQARQAAQQAARQARDRVQVVSSQVVTAPINAPPPVDVPPTSFGNLSSVVACIKAHESGNYSESSHIQEGSGAYQMIPGTWRHYAGLAGYGGYAYAYQAPPSVQDAVLMYALTHGGAGNWSMRYGNDPCTAGLPGGG